MALNKKVIYKLLYNIYAVNIKSPIATREYKIDLSRRRVTALDNNT